MNCYTKCDFVVSISTNSALAVNDLSEVLIALKYVAAWYTLGIHLRLNPATLDRIQNDYRDGRRAKEETLKIWLEQDPESTVPGSAATWEALVKALRAMEENQVANTIEDNVRHPILNQNVLSYLRMLFILHYFL